MRDHDDKEKQCQQDSILASWTGQRHIQALANPVIKVLPQQKSQNLDKYDLHKHCIKKVKGIIQQQPLYTRSPPTRHFLKYFEVKCIKTLKVNCWSHNWNGMSEELSSGGNIQVHYELWSKGKWHNHVKQILEGCDQRDGDPPRNRHRAKTERRALRQIRHNGSQCYNEIYPTPTLGFLRRPRLPKWFAETTKVEMMPYVASWERTERVCVWKTRNVKPLWAPTGALAMI